MEQAALNYRDGGATGFESIAMCVTSELAYLVEVERLRSKVGGQGDVTPPGVAGDERLSPRKWSLEDCASSCRSDNDGSASRFGTPPLDSV